MGCSISLESMNPAMLDRNIKRLFRKPVVKNAVYLYALQISNYLFPFVTIPLLIRVIGLEEYGKYVVLQTWGTTLAIVIEYGASIYGVREIASHSQHVSRLKSTTYDIIGSKLVLSLFAAIMFFGVYVLHLSFISNMDLIVIFLWAVVTGWNFIWFFQGLQEITLAALIDIFAKLFFVISLLGILEKGSSAQTVIFLQILFTACSIGTSYLLILRKVGFMQMQLSASIRILKHGFNTFLFKGLASFHDSSPLMIIAMLCKPETVGVYGVAYKLSKQTMIALSSPFWQALFPSLAKRKDIENNHLRTSELVNIIGLNFLFGVLWGGVLLSFPSVIMRIFFGRIFQDGLSVVIILAFSCPIVMAAVSGINILLSQRYESIVNISTILNLILLIILLVIMVNLWGVNGAAFATIIADLLLITTLWAFYIIKIRAMK